MEELVIGALLVLLGLGPLAMFLRGLLLRRTLRQRGVDTIGRVSSVTRQKEHKSSTVSYRDQHGHGHYLLYASVVGPKGSEVDVRYDSENPDRAIVLQNRMTYLWWLFGGLLPLAIGVRLIFGYVASALGWWT